MPDNHYEEVIGLDLDLASTLEQLARMDEQLGTVERHLASMGSSLAAQLNAMELSIQRMTTSLSAFSQAIPNLTSAAAVTGPVISSLLPTSVRQMIERERAPLSAQAISTGGPGTYPAGLTPDEEAYQRRREAAQNAVFARRTAQAENMFEADPLGAWASRLATSEPGEVDVLGRAIAARLDADFKAAYERQAQYIMAGRRPDAIGMNLPLNRGAFGTYEVARDQAAARASEQAAFYQAEQADLQRVRQRLSSEQLSQRMDQIPTMASLSLEEAIARETARGQRWTYAQTLTGADDTVAAMRTAANRGQRFVDPYLGTEVSQISGAGRGATEMDRFVADLRTRAAYGADQSRTIDEVGEAESRLGNHTEAANRTMWQQSFILFGLSMGVNSFVQELEMATGQKLPVFTRALSESLRLASDFGMMGAMMGLGPAGMAVGAAAGVGLGVFTALTALPDDVLKLNQSLQSLANKSEVITTLSTITGWTENESAAALKAAGSNYQYASSLNAFVLAREKLTNPSTGSTWQMGLQAWWQGLQNRFQNPMASGLGDATNQQLIDQQSRAYIDAALKMGAAQRELDVKQPFSRIIGESQTFAGSSARELATLTGWSEKFSKQALEAAQADELFGNQLASTIDRIIRYRVELAELHAQGKDTYPLEAANREQEAAALMPQATAALNRIQFRNPPGLTMSNAKPQQEAQIEAASHAIANQYLAALRAAGYETDALLASWDAMAVAILQSDGSVKILRGDLAAMRAQAESAVEQMQKVNKPQIQVEPDLTPSRAGQLQGYLREYENLFRSLGVEQTPQEYLMFGQGNSLYRFVTSSEAMTVAMERLRETMNDTLRGSYNIPSEWGYKPPTPWDYYAAGNHDMGPINYPWLQGGLNGTPSGVTDMPTTMTLDRATWTANTTATDANTRALGTLSTQINNIRTGTYIPQAALGALPTSGTLDAAQINAIRTGTYIPQTALGRRPGDYTGMTGTYLPQAEMGARPGQTASRLNVPYGDLITAAAAKYGVPAEYLAAIIKAESNFNPNAINPASMATGLGQVMPSNSRG